MKNLTTTLIIFFTINTAYGATDTHQLWKKYQQNPVDIQTGAQFPFQQCFEKTAERYQIPLMLLLAVARGESNFNPQAVSDKNAVGIMQILWPATAKELGIHSLMELKKPCINIDAGARYLKQLLKRYNGDIHKTLAAYNYGPGRIKTDQQATIPNGANWYSQYIYDHLQTLASAKNHDYRRIQQYAIISFHDPYLAKNFVASLRKRDSSLQLDWFDKGFGRYQVIANYMPKEKNKLLKQLARLGFIAL